MSSVMDEHDGGDSRTELESHVNMVVVCKNVPILDDTGNKMDVEKLSIVDVAVKYTCQYMAKVLCCCC